MYDGASTAAAAAQQLIEQDEEESLTGYAMTELDEYEFKILRSFGGGFNDGEYLHRVLDEEAQNGWELLEVFDNTRIRLKRPKASQSFVSKNGIEPYRTHVGAKTSTAVFVVLALLGILSLILFSQIMR